MDEILKNIALQFKLDSAPISCDRYGFGHINVTYLVVTDSGKRYIMQKVNHNIFKNVPALMENIAAVTSYLRDHKAENEQILTLVYTVDDKAYYVHEDETYWRMYDFVENSLCLQAPETPEDFYQSAVAFGSFQQQLKDFPAATLHETIPNFHNTVDRYRIFHEVLKADPCGRAKDVQEEINFVLAREEEAGTLVRQMETGLLPLRVTHNDTKLNNVMLHADTRTPLCVIDLDTVMPGLSLYDFGDSIRFGASTAAEDEKDLTKVEMSLQMFQIYTKGFLSACPGLTEQEIKMLPMGAKLMTLECGVRFLTDFLDGDHYFAVHREGQNLDRCRTQFKLVADMEAKWQQMQEIVQDQKISVS